MGEITRETVRCIEDAFVAKKDFPLTIWEKVQLARAWAALAARVEPIAGPSSGARSDKAILPAASASPVEAVEVRSPKDYAIEHAGYMATTAKHLLAAINEEDRARMVHDERDSTLSGRILDDRMATRGEAFCSLRNDIYEFEKRRDRARTLVAQPPQAVQEDERDAKRFAWYFSDKPRGEWLMTYLSGMKAGWTTDQWRSAIDAAMAATTEPKQ